MPRLSWITDENLSTALNEFRESAGNAVTEARTRQVRNVIDPFRSLLIASALDVSTASELVAVQDMDSSQRGLSNALGTFHEKVLGRVVGWENHDAGYDLENASSRLLAEVKNKHNTMNASNRLQVEAELDTAVRQKGAGWTGYLVIIVPRRPNRYQKRLKTSRPVHEVDGATFYALATGSPNAIHDLFDVVCDELTDSEEVREYCRRMMGQSFPERA